MLALIQTALNTRADNHFYIKSEASLKGATINPDIQTRVDNIGLEMDLQVRKSFWLNKCRLDLFKFIELTIVKKYLLARKGFCLFLT